MDPSVLLNVISGTINSDNELRHEAEKTLRQYATGSGLAHAYVQILANASIPTQLRHLAGVLLRQHVSHNWIHFELDNEEEDDDEFHVVNDYNQETGAITQIRTAVALSEEHRRFLEEKKKYAPIEITQDEKVAVRSLLSQLLADPIAEIRTSTGNIIAAIAGVDIENWPELIPGLISALSSGNHVLIAGGLRCFSLMTEDFTASTFGNHTKNLLQVICTLSARNSGLAPYLRASALSLYCAIIVSYTILENPEDPAFEKRYTATVMPTLSTILGNCKEALEAPYPSNQNTFTAEESCFEVRAECISIFLNLVAFFPKLMKTHVTILTSIVENSAILALPFYEQHVLRNRYSIAAGSFSEHPLAGLPQLMSNTISFYSLLVDAPKTLGKQLRLKLGNCLQIIAPLLQLTHIDCEELQDDVSQFAALENETSEYDGNTAKTTVVRKQAIIFMCQILDAWPRSAGEAIANAVIKLCTNAQVHAQNNVTTTSGEHIWWKPLEAGCLLMGQLLTDTNAYTKQTVLPLQLVIQRVLLPSLLSSQENYASDMGTSVSSTFQGVVTSDLSSHELAFLRARSSWLIGAILLPIASGALSAMNVYSNAYEEAFSNATTATAGTAASKKSTQKNGSNASKVQLSLEDTLIKSGKAVQESRNYITTLLPMLVACLQPSSHDLVRVSSAVSLRLAGISLANLDIATFEMLCVSQATSLQNPHAQSFVSPFSVDPILGMNNTYDKIIESLIMEITSGSSSSDALQCAVEAFVWCIQTSTGWEATIYENSNIYGATVIAYSQELESRGLSITSIITKYATSIIDATLQCWTQNFSDPTIAEASVDIVKALTVLPNCVQSVAHKIISVVIDVLSRSSNEVPSAISMISLEMASHVLRNTAPGWTTKPGDSLIAAGGLGAMTSSKSNPSTSSETSSLQLSHVQMISNLQDVLALANTTSSITNTNKTTISPNDLPFRYAPTSIPLNGQEIVEKLLPLIIKIGTNESLDESWLIQGACALTSTVIAIYGSVIISGVLQGRANNVPDISNPYVNLIAGICELARRMLSSKNTEMSETALAPVARLLTQILVTLSHANVIPQATQTQLFGLSLTRLVNSSVHTLTIALLAFFSRLIVQNPSLVIDTLIARGNMTVSIDVPVEKVIQSSSKKGLNAMLKPKTKIVMTKTIQEVPALQSFINILVSRANDYHSSYSCKIVFTAIAQLLTNQNIISLLSPLVVDGPEVIDTTAPMMTRSKAKVTQSATVVPKIPAIPMLIATFAEGIVRAHNIKIKGDTGDDDNLFEESDDDDDEGKEIDDNDDGNQFNASNNNGTGVGSGSIFADAETFENGMMNLDGMLDFDTLDKDDNNYDRFGDQEDFPEYVYDIMDQIDLANVGISTFVGISGELIQASIPHLNTEQQESVQALLKLAGRC